MGPVTPLDKASPRTSSPWHLETVEDEEWGYRMLLAHRLFELEETGFGLLKKACTRLGYLPMRGPLETLAMHLVWNQDRSQVVGVGLVTRFRYALNRSLSVNLTTLDTFVKPAYRLQGIGRGLATIAKASFPWVSAYHSPSAGALYNELGFQDAYEIQEWKEAFGPETPAQEARRLMRYEWAYRTCLRQLRVRHTQDLPFLETVKNLEQESLKRTREHRQTIADSRALQR